MQALLAELVPRLVTDDPLQLLVLFAWLIAYWDHILATGQRRVWLYSLTVAVTSSFGAVWSWVDPVHSNVQWLPSWTARKEMKLRIALKDRLNYLRALQIRSTSKLRRLQFVWRRKRFAFLLTSPKLEHVLAKLDSELDFHIFRLFQCSLSSETAEELFLERLGDFADVMKAGGAGINFDHPAELSNAFETLDLVASAWRDFLHSSQNDLAQAYSLLRYRIQRGPLSGSPPPGLGLRDGWGLMLHSLVLEAQNLLEERWRIVALPKRLCGYPISRAKATAALILLSLVVCLARRIFIGSTFSWPIWEVVVFALFKHTQPASYFALDPTVEPHGICFLAASLAAILDPHLAAVDVSAAIIGLIRCRAVVLAADLAAADLHDAILYAVVARNELKQRLRELRNYKREAGLLRRSD
ncbi:hypothetical protein NBRC10512_000143 [Rhodotorula toruloides]|uniref:RHTO0S08e07822g1_1 n=2 Tax=Rhodotorula toruloides TaxID=5286 RepID=A0A061B7Q7_RHOTO|nr:uncharacterized protein RHTO_00914 [Rhodotorula toruloides NP11]EMS22160.1 hypothetical protein RHTO_00914 [Rhodotorula toruloides NP11]CDR43912.1 RHTO0S08e07822g1_1 [Rhodotorula toruloides]